MILIRYHFGIPKSILECQAFDSNSIHWHIISWQSHFFSVWPTQNKIFEVFIWSAPKEMQIISKKRIFIFHNWILVECYLKWRIMTLDIFQYTTGLCNLRSRIEPDLYHRFGVSHLDKLYDLKSMISVYWITLTQYYTTYAILSNQIQQTEKSDQIGWYLFL